MFLWGDGVVLFWCCVTFKWNCQYVAVSICGCFNMWKCHMKKCRVRLYQVRQSRNIMGRSTLTQVCATFVGPLGKFYDTVTMGTLSIMFFCKCERSCHVFVTCQKYFLYQD